MTGEGVESSESGCRCVHGSVGFPSFFISQVLTTTDITSSVASSRILPFDSTAELELSLTRCAELDNRLKLTLGPASGAAIPKVPTDSCVDGGIANNSGHVDCRLSLALGPCKELLDNLQSPQSLRSVRASRRASEANKFVGSPVTLGLARVEKDKVDSGRPRKYPRVVQETLKVKRGRGRPKKRRVKRRPNVLPDEPSVISEGGN